MTNKHVDFIWYELITSDTDSTMRFYSPLLNWHYGGSAEYREIKAADSDFIGGMLPLDNDMVQAARSICPQQI